MSRLDPENMSPAERELFLRSLQTYSDSCEYPDLHPDCPFSVDTQEGRGCGEQCMDLLALNQAPVRFGDRDLGGGFGGRPGTSRPRRGPSATARAFDASELLLIDQATDDRSTWRTASLIYDLRRLIVLPPDSARRMQAEDDLAAAMATLTARGFDVEMLIRDGMWPEIVAGIIVLAIVPDLAGSPIAVAIDNHLHTATMAKWRKLLDPTTTLDGATELVKAVMAWVPRVSAWFESASLEDIIHWRPPEQETWDAFGATMLPFDSVHRWLVERFTVPYEADWSTPTVRTEWRYMHADLVPPCPPREVNTRRVDEAVLAKVFTERTIRSGTDVVHLPQPPSPIKAAFALNADFYVPVALSLLNEGRRPAAVALFNAAISLNDQDAAAYNNLGFCLLPDDPGEALVALERARDLGFPSTLLNAANRLWALHMLDRPGSALALAESLEQMWADLAPTSGGGFLWSFDHDHDVEPHLLRLPHTGLYVLAFIQHIAEATGDQALIEQWARRTHHMRALLECAPPTYEATSAVVESSGELEGGEHRDT